MNRLFQSVEDKSGRGRATDAPPNDAAGKHVDDEGELAPISTGHLGLTKEA